MKRLIFLLYTVLLPYVANAQKPASEVSSDVPTDSVTLREVTVTATKPLSRFKEDGVITTVKGTVLSKLGTAKDVLGFIPGVISANGGIEVFGKGKPLIYINGRKIRSHVELEQLTSDKLKDITVINNPGAKYSSDTQAVIRISTVKEFGEGLALYSKTTAGYKDYLYGKEQLNLNYRTGGLDCYVSFEYDNSRGKGSSMNEQNTWLDRQNTTVMDMTSKNKSQLYNGQAGINYTTQSSHSWGVYYKTTYKPSKTDTHTLSSFLLDGELQDNSLLDQKKESDYYEHLVDGYYSGKWGKWNANLTFDFLWRDNKEKQQIEETRETGTLPISILDENNGRMFAGEFHTSRPLWKGRLDLGGEYTSSTRKETFRNEESVISDNDNRIEEDNTAVYTQLAQRFGSFTLQIGLRYEHSNNDYYEYGKKMTDQSRDYDKLLPSATVMFPFRKVMFQISYSRQYRRPLYSQLSSAVHYVNQYLYETGNPLLRTPLIDNLSLNFRYKWLMMAAAYKHVKDPIVTSCIPYDDNSAITLLKKDNSSHDLQNLQVMVSAMPGFIGKVYYPVLSVGLLAQFYQTDYRGETKDMNRPVMMCQFNNIFKLPRNYMLTANFRYRSKGDSENIRMGQSWQIDLSAAKTFNNHWDMKLSFNDLFNTAKDTRFTMYSGVRDVQMKKTLNTRSVELSISYKFNMPKSRYKGKGAGNLEKNRL